MMERLTMTSDDGGLALTFDLYVTCKRSEILKIVKLAERLKHYEDLEEQGLLLELPCKVGDMVYMIDQYQGKILQKEIKQISFNNHGNWAVYAGSCVVPFDDFGKTVFLTQAEAEAALKKMGGGEK